jgi:tetratricopeptide (TPR) repeat protein
MRDISSSQSILFKRKWPADLAKASAEKAITVLKNEKDLYLLGESYAQLSQHYPWTEDLDKKISLVEQAVACFDKASPTERKARCYEELGDLYFHKRDKIYLEKALAALDSSLKIYKSINFPALQGVYILYSTVYSQTADVKRGLHYALLALRTSEKVKDTSMQLCQINYMVAVTYHNLREYKKALPYLYKALSVAEKYFDINTIYLLAHAICSTNLQNNDAIEAQKVLDRIVAKYPQPNNDVTTIQQTSVRIQISGQLNQLGNLEKYCRKLASLLDRVRLDNVAMISNYNILINGLLKLKSHSLARYYLKKEQELIKLVPFSGRNAAFYKNWVSLDSAMGDYKSALYHLLEYNKANDSIFNQAKTNSYNRFK